MHFFSTSYLKLCIAEESCTFDFECWFGNCHKASGVCTCDQGWTKDDSGICRIKYCGSGEVNFQNESCYELLTEEEADANAASGGLVEAETHCANNGYRLPHIGSEAELDFLTSLQQQRYGESEDKCFVYATCAGGTNADGLPQCHWKGWSAATVKYIGKPHWAELKPQTCSTNCDGLCATFEEDKTRFIVCRSDAVYSKPVYCERPIVFECSIDWHCQSGFCEVGRCRCESDSDCVDPDEVCFQGGCVGSVLTTTAELTTEIITTYADEFWDETTEMTTADLTTTAEVTTQETTTDHTTTAEVTSQATTTDPTTTAEVTTQETTTDPTTTAEVTTKVSTIPATTGEPTAVMTTTYATTARAFTTKTTSADPTSTDEATTKVYHTTDLGKVQHTTTEMLSTPPIKPEVSTGQATSTNIPMDVSSIPTTGVIPCTAKFPEALTFKSSCYIVQYAQSNFSTAQNFCESFLDGYLVSIGSLSEQNFLISHISTFNDYWIGLLYREPKGFFYRNGKEDEISFLPVTEYPPYNHMRNSSVCFALDRTANFGWSAFGCRDSKYFICEIDNVGYTEVTTDKTTSPAASTSEVATTKVASTEATTTEATTTEATTTEATTTEATTTEATTARGYTTVDERTTKSNYETTEEPSGCDAELCLNGATCLDFQGDFLCRCAIGYGGVLCEEDLTPDFDPALSQVIGIADLVPEDYLFINPYYVLGLYYIPLLQMETTYLSEDLTQYKNILQTTTNHQLNVKGRSDVGSYPIWSESSTLLRFLWDTNPLHGFRCSEEDGCSEGFAISFWLYVLNVKAEGTDPEYVFEINSPSFVAFAVLTEGNDILMHVSFSTGYLHQRRLSGSDFPQGWFNLGISWHPDAELELYINGRLVDATEDSSFINTFASTSPSVSVCDFAIWDRFIHSFEVHSFLGMDAVQFQVMTTADYYWNLDAFVRRDHYALINSTTEIARTTPIETANRDARKVVQDRHGKGFALAIGGQTDQWLQLGSHQGTCLSNPELCQDGLTIAMWLKLVVPSDNEFHCVFSTGAQSSRGVALYQFQTKLRAVLADGGREWITEVSMENVSSWTHLAVSWRRAEGMLFYLNGDLIAADWVGVRRIRPADLDFGFTVGRRNDFLGDFSHVTLAEAAVWYHIVRPWQARETFGFPENPYFAEALINWNAKEMFNSGFWLLSSLRRIGYYREYVSGATYDGEEGSIALSSELSTITLAATSIIPELNCLGDIDKCTDGFGLSTWIYIDSEVKLLWANGVFQIISGREGFAVQLTQRGLFVSLSLGSVQKNYVVSVLNIPEEEWFNLVVTWSQYEDLAVYINGEVMTFDSPATEVSPQDFGTDMFLVQSKDLNAVVKLHSVTVWNKYVYPKKIWQLVGVSESLLSCLRLGGAYCWPFDEPVNLMFLYQISSSGVETVDNQYFDGDALMTDDSLTGMITLGDFTGRCPHVPYLCDQGFSVSFWLKPVKIMANREAQLVSLGADVAGEVGFTISQSRKTITARVCNGTSSWEGTIPEANITYDSWMYLALIWLPESGLLLVVDGEVISSEAQPIADLRESELEGILVLGGRVRSKRLEATFDEVMVLVPADGERLPSPEYFTGSGGLVEGYASADSYFDVTDPDSSVEAVDTVLTEDRFKNEDGAADTAKSQAKDFGYVTVGDFPFHCLSDPAMCHPAGLTISLWIKMGPTDHFQNPSTNSEGVGYILSSGAQTPTSHGYAAHFNNSHITSLVVDGTKEWSTSFRYTFGSNWTNYALGWNEEDGLNVFVDGEVKGSNETGALLDVSRPSDEFTHLQLGKRNDAEDGYLGAAFDDVAIWIYTFSPDDPELSKTLKGEETKEEEIEVTQDHEKLLEQAPPTWRVDCQVIHEADCARNIKELFEIVNDQVEFNANATKSIYGRLLNLTSEKDLPDSSDIQASINVMDEMSKVGLPSKLTEDDAMNIYESFAESVSNLLADDLFPLWENISEAEYGVAALMQNLETLGVQVAAHLPMNNEYTGCSTIFRKERLMTCMDRFPVDAFGLAETVMPPLIDLGSNVTNGTDEEYLNIEDTIKLPRNLFRFTEDGEAASFVFSHFDNLQDVLFSNMSNDLPVRYAGQAVANSRIISLAIDPPLSKALYNPITITLRTHQQYNNETVQTVCAFWNFSTSVNSRGWWDTGGCELTSSNDTHVICSCNHLTHFAVVSSPIVPVVPNPHHTSIAIMALIVFSMSMIFLTHLVFTFIRHRRLHTLRNSIHLHECLAVVFLGLTLVVATMGRNSEELCRFGGISLHYFSLSVLIWIVIEALQLSEDSYRGIQSTDEKNHSQCDDRLKIYYATGWGLPVLVVATTVAGGTNPHHQIGSGICFLSQFSGMMWAFYGPFIFGTVCAVLLLLVVARYYDIHIKRQDRAKSFRSSLMGTCVLAAYYSVAWTIGSKGLYGEVMWIQYIFVFLLSSMGFIFYVMHGLGNTEVRALLFCEDPDVALTAVQDIYIFPEEEIELPPKPVYRP